MPMPLEGVRVLDWTIWQQGPVCTAILGDLGADVIKIEERVGGDPGRGMLRLAGLEISDRPNFYFTANNRNKRGITLDLKKPEARGMSLPSISRAERFRPCRNIMLDSSEAFTSWPTPKRSRACRAVTTPKASMIAPI